MSMRWPPVIFVYRPKSVATCGDDRELLRGDLPARDARDDRVGAVLLHVGEGAVVGVLQGAAAGIEDVGCRSGVARIEAMTGLQMSQPRPVPKRSMICSNDVSCRMRTDSKSSLRLSSMCSHSALETAMPALVSSFSSSFFTSGTHEPHCVPARVQALSAPSSVHASSWSPRMADPTAPTETLLHEHSCASSGSSPGRRLAARCREVGAGLGGQFAAEQRAQ